MALFQNHIYAQQTPPSEELDLVFSNRFSFIKRYEKQIVSFDIANTREVIKNVSQSYELRYKYKIIKEIAVGVGLTKAYGILHDEDWVTEDSSWQWRDIDDRSEEIVDLGIYTKTIASGIDLKNIIIHIDAVVTSTSFQDKTSLFFHPYLRYVFLEDRKKKSDIVVGYGHYRGLNHHSKEMYKQYFYVGPNYYLNENVSIGGQFGYYYEEWTSTPSFIDATGESYSSNHTSFRALLNVKIKI